jgi:hypothetical protein
MRILEIFFVSLIHVEIKISIFAKAGGGNRPKSYYFHQDPGYKQCCGSGSRIRCFFTPESGIRIRDGKKSGSEMNIPDHISESLKKKYFGLKMPKIVYADPGSFRPWIRDGEIWNKQPGTATLDTTGVFLIL